MENETIDTRALDDFALKTRFPEECKRLPMEYLEPSEQIIVEKCINHETLTDDELSELKQLLVLYRPFLKKYDVTKVEKNIEDNVRVIKSSKELLSLLNNPDRYRFDMHYRLDGELLRLQFRIKPLSDNEFMDLMSVQTRVFRELDNDEKIVYGKLTNNMELSSEEMKMQQQIQDKIVDMLGDVDNTNEQVTKFLINHVEFVNDDNEPLEAQEELWHAIDMGTRTLIYNKCKEILKIDDNLEEELFPPVR